MDVISHVTSFFCLHNDVSICSSQSLSSIKQVGIIAGTAISSFAAGYYVHYMSASSIATAGVSLGLGLCCYFKYVPTTKCSIISGTPILCTKQVNDEEINKAKIPLANLPMKSKWEIKKCYSAPLVSRRSNNQKQRAWRESEINNFIDTILGKTNITACFNQLERMDGESIQNFTFKLVDEKKLDQLWNFEKKVTNQFSSIEKRKERLGIIFQSLNEFQINHSVKCSSFWEIVCDRLNGYAQVAMSKFSVEQFAIITINLPEKHVCWLAQLFEAYTVPNTKAERAILSKKLAVIQECFSERKCNDLKFSIDTKAVDRVLNKLNLVLKIGTFVEESS